MLQRLNTPPGAVAADHTQVAFGALVLAYTTTFTPTWTDRGSGARRDVGFWMPTAPEGFRPLGGVGMSSYDNPAGRMAALCVRPAEEFPGAVAAPVGYDCIWADHGSGARADGSCWRPRAPEGYVALGDIFVEGYGPPPLDAVWCVHKDHVWDGVVADSIWDDAKSGADTDFSAWTVNPISVFLDEKTILIAPGAFVGTRSHAAPQLAVKVLRLPPPIEAAAQPPVPTLDGYESPPDESDLICYRRVTTPFTAVIDEQYDLNWKVAHSPFYVVERLVNFQLEAFDHNETAEPHVIGIEVKVGVSTTVSEAFSKKVGVSISYETGVSLGIDAKVKGTLSHELGYSSATSVTSFQERTIRTELKTPGGHAAAMWAPRTLFQVRRADDTLVSAPLALEDNTPSFYVRQYPAPANTKPRLVSVR